MSRFFAPLASLFFAAALLSSCSTSTQVSSESGEKSGFSGDVRGPSPFDEANPASIRIEGLEADSLYVDGAEIRIVVENYPVGEGWQGFQLVVNDEAPERFYDSNVVYRLPVKRLRKGANLLKAYLIRSWGESLKNPEAFAYVPFYYGERRGLSWVAPGRPILTLVSPRGVYEGEAGKKVLFDFIVHDPDSDEPRKVHYTLNGKKLQLNSGRSYDFSGLAEDDYDLRVEVVNSRGIPLGQEVTRSRSKFSIKNLPEPEVNND